MAAAAGTVALVLLVWLVLRVGPDWLAQTHKLSHEQVAEELGRVRTALLALLGGIVAVAGAMFAGLTFSLSRRGHFIDRFTRAVDQLGGRAVEVRIGGIYALERLACDSNQYRGAVLEVLVAYIREHGGSRIGADPSSSIVYGPVPTQAPPAAPPTAEQSNYAAADVRAAIAVLARRDTSHELESPRFDLTNTNLRGVRAEGINLKGCLLTGAHLEDARLEDAQLQGAILVRAHLQRTRLGCADLSGASLNGAHLEGADLRNVKGLDDASLEGASYARLSTPFPEGFKPEKHGMQAV